MRSVLVTGAGRGIGLAVTTRLASAGWQVFAGARSDAHLGELGRIRGVNPVGLDITDAAQVDALTQHLPAGLDAVVNNAGTVLYGPVETVKVADLARQLEVNVTGQVAVTQAVLPRLRDRGGRLVFVSSMSGRRSTLGSGAYNASKYALEGIVDALRIELRQWRIPVSLVEPGTTDTDIWQGAATDFDAMAEQLSRAHADLYRQQLQGVRSLLPVIHKRLAVSPDRVAAVIERALNARRPRARYLCDAMSRLETLTFAFTPTAVTDAVIARAIGASPQRATGAAAPAAGGAAVAGS